MNKAELVMQVAEKTQLTRKESEQAVNAVMESIEEALARGERVSLVGFGTFEVRQRKSRSGRNPQTGETITIPETRVPAFKPGKGLRDTVSNS